MRGSERADGLSGKRLNQDPQELAAFVELLRAEGATSYLEVGCRWGDTLHKVGMTLPEGSRIVGVDLPGIKTGGLSYRIQGSEPYLVRAVASLREAGRDAHLVIGNSRDAATIVAARFLGPFDALLIDADHTSEGATSDWHNYGPMARIVAFHDVMNRLPEWGVRELYLGLAIDHRSKIISTSNHRRGIGLIWNGP